MGAPKQNPPPKGKEFKSAKDIENVLRPCRDIERLRAQDRALIASLFNGLRPYNQEEVEKFQIQINVNWQEGKRIMRDANAQINSALLHTGTLFNCSLESGPMDKRDEWGQIFTTEIQKPLQRGKSGRKHYFLLKSRNASVCMHGIGALLWTNGFRWMPRFVPLEDLLIPTDTYCDFTNLRYFGVNMYLTPGELTTMAMGDKALPGWNKPMVAQILDSMKNLYNEGIPSTWRDQPEEMEQIFTGNKGYYYSDAVPKIRVTWFFYQEVDKPNKWYRCVILREAYGDAKPADKMLFDGTDKPFADDIMEILAVQYGDNNLVAPLKYHSVRGLGLDLYAPVETMNRLRCQFVQSVFEHLLMYFRIQDPSDRDRLKQVVLNQFGILPEGLNIVPREQRHQIDPQLVAEAQGQIRQIMQESSASYLQNINDGTEKEMTAKEATIKLNQATVMVSAMLQSLYLQEGFYYEEIVRRFCNKSSDDAEVKAFREKCISRGIPEQYVNDNKVWRVMPEKVLGGGDKSQAQQEASWLWGIKNELDPSVQPMVKRKVISTMLNDPDKGKEFVPITPPTSTAGTIAAENCFGTLMTGNPVAPRTGIDQQGYLTRMIQMMSAVVEQIKGGDNMGTMPQIVGLAAVAQNIQQTIQAMSNDPNMNQMVKQAKDVLGKLVNELKGFSQRLQQKHQAADLKESLNISFKDLEPDTKNAVLQMIGIPPSQMSGQDPAAVAKTAQEMKLKEASHNQQSQLDTQRFQAEQDRENLKTANEIQRKNVATHHEIVRKNIQATADALNAEKKSVAKSD